MIQIEEQDLQTANAIYYQTWHCSSMKEKAHPTLILVKRRPADGVKVSMITKLKSPTIRFERSKKEYETS